MLARESVFVGIEYTHISRLFARIFLLVFHSFSLSQSISLPSLCFHQHCHLCLSITDLGRSLAAFSHNVCVLLLLLLLFGIAVSLTLLARLKLENMTSRCRASYCCCCYCCCRAKDKKHCESARLARNNFSLPLLVAPPPD